MNIRMNMSRFDRGGRLIAGILLLVLVAAAIFSPLVDLVLLLAALVLIGTAATGFCPLYRLLGLSTFRPSTPETHTRSL